MEKVDSLAKQDYPASLQEFTKHLPPESLKKYVEKWRAGKVKKTSGLEILRSFLEEERQYLKDYKQLVGEQCVEDHYGILRRDNKVASRLSACQAWKDQSLEDRAAFVEKVQGCALCLDWTGNHQASNCS